jgi:phosphatidate cytidylyltransferase
MLKKRIGTALVLLSLLAGVLWCGHSVAWQGLVLLGGALAMEEWHALNTDGVSKQGRRWRVLVCGVCMGLGVCLAWVFAWAVNPCLWGLCAWGYPLGLAGLLYQGSPAWARYPRGLRAVLGVVVLGLLCLSLWQARAMGVIFLLSVLSVVWVSDVGAYFAGRTWGRHKLAAHISPGKTWEGVFGGGVAVLCWASAWMGLERSFVSAPSSLYYRLWLHGPWVWFAGLAFLVGLGVAGDLWESLIKRSAGVKDSGQCLPGHGGLLDRIDALIPVVPVGVYLGLIA